MDFESHLDSLIVLGLALASAATPLVLKLTKTSRAVGKLISGVMKFGVVSHADIDAAVERILSGGHPPNPFVDFVGDVVADLITRLPDYLMIPKNQRMEMIASVISDQSRSKFRRIVPEIPDALERMKWSRFQVVLKLLHAWGVLSKVEEDKDA
jgi:hypothetical protein